MTSKGCVASVAIAPADAAETLCIRAAWPFEAAGTIDAKKGVREDENIRLKRKTYTLRALFLHRRQ